MNNKKIKEKILLYVETNKRMVEDFLDASIGIFEYENYVDRFKEMVDDGVNENILTPSKISAMTFYDWHEDAILDILDNEFNSRYSFVEAICEMGENCYRIDDLKYMFGMYALDWCAKVVYNILSKKGVLYEG